MPSQFHNYDLKIVYPDGTIKRSTSDIQNNEFIVFDASQTGNYVITVSSDGTLITLSGEPFVLSSTHGIDKFPFAVTTTPPQPINPILPPTNSYADDFDDLNNWTLSGDRNWIVDRPQENVPNENSRTNMVIHSENCDRECIVTLNQPLDTSRRLNVSFDRYVADNVDRDEGLYVQYSVDGNTWITLVSYTENNNQHTDQWMSTRLILNIREDTANFRFVAKSSNGSEKIEVDNLLISRVSSGGGGSPPRPTDTTPPTFTSTVVDVLAQTDGTGIVVSFPTPLINESGTVTCDPSSGSIFFIGTTIVTCTATDSAGNPATISFDVTVTLFADDVNPVITLPGDKTFEATSQLTPISASQIGQATATDNRDAEPDITNNAPSTFPLGTTLVTWTATDDSGNQSSAVQRITIRDTTAPIISSLSNITIEAMSDFTVLTLSNPTVTDIFPTTITHDAPMQFPLGTTTVTWTAVDTSGNPASTSQDIIIADTIPPQFIILQDMTFEATGLSTLLSQSDYGTPSATDHFTVTITHDAPNSFPLGDTVINWTLVDSNGNAATTANTITIQDTTAPTITAPSDVTLESTDVFTKVSSSQLGQATSIDSVDRNPIITHDAPNSFPLGDTIVIWYATDSSNNRSSATQMVTIHDTTKPVFAIPADIAISTDSTSADIAISTASTSAIVNFNEPVATDIFPVTITCDYTSDHSFFIGTTIVTCTATDDSGNSASTSFTVSVSVSSPPVLPSTPTRLLVTGANTNSVTLSWDDADDDSITGYKILCRDISTGDALQPCIEDTASTDTTHVVENLLSGAVYVFRVISINGIEESPQSNYVQISTTLLAPTNLLVTGTTHNSVTLSWDDTNDDRATGYTILCRDDLYICIFDTGSSDTTHVVEHLSPDTAYVFRVIAINDFIHSEHSNFVRVATDSTP